MQTPASTTPPILRWTAGLSLCAVVLVIGAERIFFSEAPLLANLHADDRTSLYEALITVSVTLMGFLITAVAILVSLDMRRTVVEELHRGESFALLVVNLLAAVFFLLNVTVMSIIGVVGADGIGGAVVFASVYEWLALSALFEIALGGFFFCLVTYKVAAYN